MLLGEKIKMLRMQHGLTQEELANRCELSKGFISQLERDLTSPSIATLIDILECLGTDLKTFFNDSDNEKVVFSKGDFFVKQTEKQFFIQEISGVTAENRMIGCFQNYRKKLINSFVKEQLFQERLMSQSVSRNLKTKR